MGTIRSHKDDCLESCPKFFCDFSDACYGKSRYNTNMLSAFTIINLVFAVFQVVLLVLFVRMRRHQGAKQQILLLAIALVALLLRAFWYEMSKYYFGDDFTVKLLQTINAVQLTLMIFEQCIYIQSWFKVILVFSHMRGERAVKITFPILYLVISIISVAAIIWRICQTR